MAYVTLEFLSSELLERAVQAVTRSRELCANTSRLIKEMRDGIVAVQGTGRQSSTSSLCFCDWTCWPARVAAGRDAGDMESWFVVGPLERRRDDRRRDGDVIEAAEQSNAP